MPALNFVAADDGLEDDPKLLTLARLMRVPRSVAFWWVMRWQRLILHKGNHLLGSLPKNYTAVDIAAFLEFSGDPRRLIDALKKQGYVSFKKGRGFFYPGWPDTRTGRYASHREADRRRHESDRKAASKTVVRASADVRGPSADVHEPSADEHIAGLQTPEGHSTVRKEASKTGVPPDPPPVGGASLADARWDWLYKHAPTPQNRVACRAIVERLPEPDWALVQRAYSLLHQPGASLSKRNRRALDWPTDQFLRKEAYFRFRENLRPTKTTPVTNPLVDFEKRLADRDAFVMGLLRDPEESELKKTQVRERWLKDPQNRDRQPPWDRPNGENAEASALGRGDALASGHPTTLIGEQPLRALDSGVVP